MSGISTHILDTSKGQPGANIRVRLFQSDREIGSSTTGADGRCSALLPKDVVLSPGVYRIVFEIGSQFSDGFYPEVAVSFHVRDVSQDYHVPLLISGFGYTTYRGS